MKFNLAKGETVNDQWYYSVFSLVHESMAAFTWWSLWYLFQGMVNISLVLCRLLVRSFSFFVALTNAVKTAHCQSLHASDAKCSKELASMIGLTENVLENFLSITFFSDSKPNLESVFNSKLKLFNKKRAACALYLLSIDIIICDASKQTCG